MARKKARFVICVKNGRYKASLEVRKIYRVLDDPAAEAEALLRVIDESGEDYLFPESFFVPVELPAKAAPAFKGEPAPAR